MRVPLCTHLVLIVVSLAFGYTNANAQTAPSNRYEYDALGNLTKVTDGLNHATSLRYDALSRLTQQLQPPATSGATQPTINYGYDGRAQPVSVTDPRALRTSYTLDGFGQIVAQNSPDTGNSSRVFDDGGNLVSSTNANGEVTTYSYDLLQRLTRIHFSSGADTVFDYDGVTPAVPNAKNKLTRVTDDSGQTSYGYDEFGRLNSKIQTVGSITFPVTYIYGNSNGAAAAIGKRTSITYPSGNRVTTIYDAAGRVSALYLNPTAATSNGIAGTATDLANTIPLLINLAYQPFGLPTSWTWGNSTALNVNTYARAIDQSGRVTAYPLGNALYSGITQTLTFDAASRITASRHELPEFDQTYAYDDLDRIVQFNSNVLTQSFSYDASGNRTSTTVGGTVYPQTISATSNRLTASAGPLLAKTNTFNAAGQLLNDGRIVYAYNGAGRIKQVTLSQVAAPNVVTYRYNGFGQRVQKSGPDAIVASGNQYLVFDEQGHVIGEYDAAGRVIQETVYLDDLPVAVLKQSTSGTAPNQATTTAIYYVYADHLNTPRVLIRSTDNNIVWHWVTTDAFGVLPPDENPFGFGQFVYNLRFPGQLFDRETNTHYNYYRDYDPLVGRYLQSDPIGLRGGINTYSYALSSPVRYADPTGQAVPLVVCMANPVACAALVGATVAVAAKACIDTAQLIRNWYAQENTNPYEGPVDTPVVVVDENGNAIPVGEGEQVNSSPSGDYQQVLGSDGRPTGVRLDRGGHRNQSDPRARNPHGHVPGVTLPDGNSHLPIRY